MDEGEERAHMRLVFVEFLEAVRSCCGGICATRSKTHDFRSWQVSRLADSLFAPGEKIETDQPAALCLRLPRFIKALAATL